MKIAVIGSMLALFTTLAAGPALAQVYGNPIPFVPDKNIAAGLEYGNFTRKLKAKFSGSSDTGDATLNRTNVRAVYGLGNDLAADFYLGTLRVEPSNKDLNSASGTEFGAGVRKATGPLGAAFSGAVTAEVRTGSLSGTGASGSFTQLDVTFGAVTQVQPDFYGYAGAVLSKFDSTMSVDIGASSTNVTFEGDSLIGLYGGAEYAPAGKKFRAGLELHLLHETGFGFYGLLSF